jgi:hypothetical protein
MVFLGILPEGLLEIYDAANSWNPTTAAVYPGLLLTTSVVSAS